MSKRYGRNQKRKHRERIAELELSETQLTYSRNLERVRADGLDGDLRQLHTALSSVTPYSAFVPPRVLQGFDVDSFRHIPFEVIEETTLLAEMAAHPDHPFELVRNIRDIPVSRATAAIYKDRVKFRTLIHFKVQSSDGTRGIAYIVSDDALEMSRAPGAILEHVVEDCMKQLLETPEGQAFYAQ